MAVNEQAFGPFYFARIKLNQPACPAHFVKVTEMGRPWRKGRALVLGWGDYLGLAFGLWHRTKKLADNELDGERWLNMEKVGSVRDLDISLWRNGLDEDESESAPPSSRSDDTLIEIISAKFDSR